MFRCGRWTSSGSVFRARWFLRLAQFSPGGRTFSWLKLASKATFWCQRLTEIFSYSRYDFSLACCQTSFLCEVAAFKCPIYPILKTLPGEMVCLAVDFLRDMVCIPGFLDSHQGPRIIPHSRYIRYNRNKLIPSWSDHSKYSNMAHIFCICHSHRQ